MELSYNPRDYDYRTAVNCEHTQYFNPPITVTVQNVKYILPFGTMDCKNSLDNGEILKIVATNPYLDYAYLAVINTTEQTCVEAHLDQVDKEFFDLDLIEQIRRLSNYLPF